METLNWEHLAYNLEELHNSKNLYVTKLGSMCGTDPKVVRPKENKYKT